MTTEQKLKYLSDLQTSARIGHPWEALVLLVDVVRELNVKIAVLHAAVCELQKAMERRQ